MSVVTCFPRGQELWHLLQISDQFFPTGGYAFSHALETYIAAGIVHDRLSCHQWLANVGRYALGPCDLVFCAHAHRLAAGTEAEPDTLTALLELDHRLAAYKVPRELRQESQHTGQAFLRAAMALEPVPLVQAIWQQVQRWPTNGEEDYPRNLRALSAYLTPSCRAFLQQDYEYRRASGELRRRVRGIYEIPGRGYGDDPATRIKVVSDRDWIVTLDVSADEYYGSEQVKRALVRYPIKVVRLDIDPERNPFGLALDCYAGAPQRIEPTPTPIRAGTPANASGRLQGAP